MTTSFSPIILLHMMRVINAMPILLVAVLLASCGGTPKDETADIVSPTVVDTLPAETDKPAEAEKPPTLLSVLDELPAGIDGLLDPWHGDLDGMIERRMIRVLTVFNPMLYFLDGPDQHGIVYEGMAELERTLNEKLKRRRLRVNVVIIPVTRDELIPALLDGRGDIVAANLTVTPERLEQVDFTRPTLTGVSEVLVTGPAAQPIDTIEALSGRELHLRRSSSYWASAEGLNRDLAAAGLPPVKLSPASEWVEDGGLLELVDNGSLPMTVVDSHKARFWAQFLRNIEVHEDLALRTGGEIAWAMRKDSPQLEEELNGFIRRHGKGTLFGNVILKRYLEHNRWVRNAADTHGELRFRDMSGLFRLYGDQFELDWLMIAAQAYQESGLDQSKRSHAGAIGVMQLLPVAADEVGVTEIDELENNIHAGTKYLRTLMDRYLDDEAIDEEQRHLLALAAYNAGPTRIRRLRRKAEAAGLDPNVWFDNMEVLVARHVGAEPVHYVSNIVKYYVVYRMLAERLRVQPPAES